MRDQLSSDWMIVYLTLQSGVIVVLLAGVASTAVHRIRTKSTEALLSPVFRRLEEQEHRIVELEVADLRRVCAGPWHHSAAQCVCVMPLVSCCCAELG